MLFHKIGFIGLGLIGGSIAKKIKANDPTVTMIATSHHQKTIEQAHEEGLIENDSLLPMTDFSDCDLIFLCAPVQNNIGYLKELKGIIKSTCYITDVGSTKTSMHDEVLALGLEKNFIGGHPMTGSEKTGILNASDRLLENAYYIITPTEATPKEDVEQFRDFVRSLGSIPLIMDYQTHDYSTAAISHLPHMIAFTLVNLVQNCDDSDETMKTIAAGGFRDITRIASSSPVMWQSICSSNRKQILTLMDRYMELFSQLKEQIAQNDEASMLDFFQQAKDYRDSFAVRRVKSPDRYYELLIDLADEPGGIATVAIILAFQQISIKNIGIIHNREYEEGVLRIEFYDEESMLHATELLEHRNYVIYNRK